MSIVGTSNKSKKKDIIYQDNFDTTICTSINNTKTNVLRLTDKLHKKIVFYIQAALSLNSNDNIYQIYTNFIYRNSNINNKEPNKNITNPNIEIKLKLEKNKTPNKNKLVFNLFELLSKYITCNMLSNIKEEKNSENLCGFPSCFEYKLKDNNLYKFKENNTDICLFCSKDCYNAYNQFYKNSEFICESIINNINEIKTLGHIATIFIENKYFKKMASTCYEAINPFPHDNSLYNYLTKILNKNVFN